MGLGGRSDNPDSGQTATTASTEKSVARGSSSGSTAGTAGSNRWCLIESDPGVFTELVEKLGVHGVAFEEVFGLDESSFASIQRRKPLELQSEKEWEGSSSSSTQRESGGKDSDGSPTDQQQKMDVDTQEQTEEKEEEMQERHQEDQQKKEVTHKEEGGKEGQLRKIFGFIFLFNWSKDKKSSRAAKSNKSPASAAAGAAALARQQKAAKEASKSDEGATSKKADDRREGGEKPEESREGKESGKDEKAATTPGSSSSGSSSYEISGTSNSFNSVDNYPEDLFFARQVIPNACASQAILSVLINKRNEIPDVGPTIGALIEFTKDFFDPFMRGEAIGNSEAIREAHNSFRSSSSFFWTQDDDDDDKEDAFHFVSYIHFQGHAYEIDGLEEAPKCLGTCTQNNWTEVVRQQLLKRVAKIQDTATGELRFNLMAVVEDELSRVQKEILRQRILAQRANVKRICLGEDLALDEEVEDDHLDATDIPSIEQLPENLEELRNVVRQAKEKRRLLELRELEELDIRARWKNENIRRRHDFVPFLLCILRHVARRGELVAAVEAAREAAARRRQSREKKTAAVAASSAASPEGSGKNT